MAGLTKVLQVRVTNELYDAAKAKAERAGSSVCDMVRESLENWVARESTALVKQGSARPIEAEYVDPDETPEQRERNRRKEAKAQRHAELKAGCRAALPEVVPERMKEKMRAKHDAVNCRVWGCFMCKAAGHKAPERGLR